MKLSALAICSLFAGCQLAGTKPRFEAQVYALKYAESEYPAKLVNTRPAGGKVYMHWLAYLIKGADGSFTLIDCGFSDPQLVKKFGLRNFKPVPKILAQLGIDPRQILTLILTHTHFDHALDVGLFTAATVYVHAGEIAKPESTKLKPVFQQLKEQNRLKSVQQEFEVAPGLEAVHVGGHTRGSLVIRLKSGQREYIFTGDECYFARECRQGIGLPAAAAFDQNRNRAFIRSLTPDALLLTGHEPHAAGGRWQTPQIFFFDGSVM